MDQAGSLPAASGKPSSAEPGTWETGDMPRWLLQSELPWRTIRELEIICIILPNTHNKYLCINSGKVKEVQLHILQGKS